MELVVAVTGAPPTRGLEVLPEELTGSLQDAELRGGTEPVSFVRPEPMRGDGGMIALVKSTVQVDHVGIAVRSIQEARRLYEGLGMVCGPVEEISAERVKVAMLSGGEGGRVELLEAIDEGSAVGQFVAKRGEGMHHVALRVADVDAEFLRMKAEGVRLVREEVGVGAGGHRYFFMHPADAGGVLVEIVG